MVIFKNSSLYLALCSIVLFASIAPVTAMNFAAKAQKNSNGRIHTRRAKQLSQSNSTQINTSLIKSEIRKLTWKQKLRKNLKAFGSEVKEFISENPVATFATLLGGALLTWIIWNKVSIPWERRENIVGNSACQIIEAQLVPDTQRDIFHILFERDPVRNEQTGLFEEGEAVRRDVRVLYRFNNQTPITQLRVARQGFDGSCGYHATKNCMLILNEIAHPQGNLQASIEGHQICQQLFGQDGAWRQFIVADPAHRVNEDCREGGDWLSGAAIQNIIDHEHANQRLLQNQNAPITVIENAFNIAHPYHNDPLFNATQVARDAYLNAQQNNQPYTHGFIFNTARTRIVDGQPVAPRRDGGHWMAAVLHRNAAGETRWFVADSANRIILESPVLRDLIAAVQGEVVQGPPAQ